MSCIHNVQFITQCYCHTWSASLTSWLLLTAVFEDTCTFYLSSKYCVPKEQLPTISEVFPKWKWTQVRNAHLQWELLFSKLFYNQSSAYKEVGHKWKMCLLFFWNCWVQGAFLWFCNWQVHLGKHPNMTTFQGLFLWLNLVGGYKRILQPIPQKLLFLTMRSSFTPQICCVATCNMNA